MKTVKKKRFGTALFFVMLALCLCGSIYLNWYFGGRAESAKTLGETKYVDADVKEEKTGDYFTTARIERQAAYDKAVEELNAVLANSDDAESKARASEKLTDMALYDSWQLKIEKLVKAKGFKECLALISDNNTSVVVAATSLTAAEAASVMDIVMRTTGQKSSEIQITTYYEEKKNDA